MCYSGMCRWESRDGECRYRGAVPPCETRDEDDELDEDDDEERPDWWDGEDEGRDPDELYDAWAEKEWRE